MPTDNDWLRRIAIALEGGSSPGGGLTGSDIAPIVNALNPSIVTYQNSTGSQIYTVPAGKRWRVRCGIVDLITRATVANRRLTFQVVTAVGSVLNLPASAIQVANETRTYTLAQLSGDRDFVNNYLLIPIPEFVLISGDRFELVGFDPTDTITSSFLVEEWPT